MLTAIILRRSEWARLSRVQRLALEFLVHDRLSEIARHRRSGDTALLLAIRAAEYLEPLLDELGAGGCDDLLTDVRVSDLGLSALLRTEEMAALAERSPAA